MRTNKKAHAEVVRQAKRQNLKPADIYRIGAQMYVKANAPATPPAAFSPAPVPAAPAAPAPSIAEVPAGSPVDGESLPQIAQ